MTDDGSPVLSNKRSGLTSTPVNHPAGDAGERLERAVLIEPIIGTIRFGSVARFQLTANLCGRCVDIDSGQMVDVTIATVSAENWDYVVTVVEAILNGTEENTILFVTAIEECTDVLRLCHLSTCEWNRLR